MTELKKLPEELTFDYIFEKLFNYWKNIAIGIFKWNGLEQINELTSTIIEEQLMFDKGMSAFFKDNQNGFLCLPASEGYGKNVYGKPTKFNVTALNGEFNKYLEKEDCVIIKNNNLGEPIKDMLEYYCCKLAEIELTKQLNLNANKMPLMFYTDEETVLSDKNVFKQIRTMKPVIFKNKYKNMDGIDKEPVKILNANAPYILDKLEDDYNCYVAKILTLLGYDNYVEDKAERVQSAEVSANEEYIIASFRTMLEQRNKACEEINAKYGLNLSIEYVAGEQIEPTDDIEDGGEINE